MLGAPDPEVVTVHPWTDVADLLKQEAEQDLDDGVPVSPCLAAGLDEDIALMAFLRPFPKGEYVNPMIELLALAGALGADRLALSISGRAWSLEDPVPPVVDGVGDLRQRVVVIHTVSATAGGTEATSTLHPFNVHDGVVVWGTPVTNTSGEGWLLESLRVCVEQRAALRTNPAKAVQQLERCRALGHLVALTPDTARRLASAGVAG
ncbi:MAG TPA: hypothetical protein VM307_05060 [Egibacteraceae bacterium]|nr:hypothetical protein [Egibacteraceae bacterium]